MKIDPATLRSQFDQYLRTDSGRAWISDVGYPGWLLLLVAPIQAFCGYLLLFTIVRIPLGLRWIAAGFTFRLYRESLRKRIQEKVDELQVLPACGIIIGPSGAALVLASSTPIEIGLLSQLAADLGELYSAERPSAGSKELWNLLRDDVYQPNRRRRVPAANSSGHTLWLLDIPLKLDECGEWADQPVLGVAMTPGKTGVHVQVPWDALRRAIPKPSDPDVSQPTRRERPSRDEAGESLFEDLESDAGHNPDEIVFAEIEDPSFDDPDTDDAWNGSTRQTTNSDDSLDWLGQDEAPATSPASRTQSRQPRRPLESPRRVEPEEIPRGLSGVLRRAFRWSGEAVALVALGILLCLLFPTLTPWLIAAYIVGGVLLLFTAWGLGFRHAIQTSRLSTTLFLFPPYFIRYAVRNWPETQGAVNAVCLVIVWISAPFLVGPPMLLLGQILTAPARRAADLAGNPRGPQPPIVELQPVSNEFIPVDPRVFPTRLQRRTEPNGTMTTTVQWSDQTVATYVRRSLGHGMKLDFEKMRTNTQLARQVREARVGEVLQLEVYGSEIEFVYGGRDGIYTSDSPPSAAAVHAGLIRVGETKMVKITMLAPQMHYPMLEQNGMMSFQKIGDSSLAYRIERLTD